MSKGFQNFVKVFIKALVLPTRLITLGIALLFSFALPNTTVIIVPTALIAVLIMAFIDTNNEDFIKKSLSQNTRNVQDIKELIKNVNSSLRKKSFKEVRIDLENAIKNLDKIQDSLEYLNSKGQPMNSFVLESVSKMISQLIKLSNQEELARKYLATENLANLQNEITNLKQQVENLTDQIAKKEYSKVIQAKENQVNLYKNIQQRLERIDSYIAGIISALEATHSYLTKLSLKDESDMINESAYLTANLESVVNDIDIFENQMLEISQELESQMDSKKNEKDKVFS